LPSLGAREVSLTTLKFTQPWVRWEEVHPRPKDGAEVVGYDSRLGTALTHAHGTAQCEVAVENSQRVTCELLNQLQPLSEHMFIVVPSALPGGPERCFAIRFFLWASFQINFEGDRGMRVHSAKDPSAADQEQRYLEVGSKNGVAAACELLASRMPREKPVDRWRSLRYYVAERPAYQPLGQRQA